MKKILVIGSLNMDFVVKVAQMPKKGETIMGKKVSLIPGGKGANQAYAIGKLGGHVAMMGAVGVDSFGEMMCDNLRSAGVEIEAIRRIEKVDTGQAYITVDDCGQNSIIVIAGANGMVDNESIDRNICYIDEADIVIMQFEVPVGTVKYVKEIAKRKNKLVIVDPAPAVPGLPDSFWQGIDYIKPNEIELEVLVGRKMSTEAEQIEGAKELLRKGVKNVIVTLGEKGCLYVTENITKIIPTDKVDAIDTTAAGDAFTAAFAFAISQGKMVEEAIAFGQKVSGIVVTRKGAQTSMPGKEELEA